MTDKLREMLLAVLKPPKKRRPTKPTKGSKVRRLKEKKARSQTKAGRQYRGRQIVFTSEEVEQIRSYAHRVEPLSSEARNQLRLFENGNGRGRS